MKLNQQIAIGIIAVSTMVTAVALAARPPADTVVPQTHIEVRCYVVGYSLYEPPGRMLDVLRAAYAAETGDRLATVRWDRLDGRIVACAHEEVAL